MSKEEELGTQLFYRSIGEYRNWVIEVKREGKKTIQYLRYGTESEIAEEAKNLGGTYKEMEEVN